MNKLASLRAALLALPDLATDPQKLQLFAERGQLVATGAPGDGWEYRYQATASVQDFAGDMDVLAAVVIEWLTVEQPDLLLSQTRREQAVRFEVAVMDNEQADVWIEVDLIEPVLRHGGVFTHPSPPPADPSAMW